MPRRESTAEREALNLVALVSSYKEGPLIHGCLRSALAATDTVLVFEGPAGDPLDGCPDTELSPWQHRVWLKEGAWRTDAEKRTAMVAACRRFDPPVWAVWIDGDEVLCNAEYLRDWLQAIQWDEEASGTDDLLGWPLKLVELDGSVSVCRGKVVRVDRIDSYSVSSSVFKDALGKSQKQGNVPYSVSEHIRPIADWIEETRKTEPLKAAAMEDTLRLLPPLPTEPFLMHRSALRHPARRGLRMHEQEARELERAGLG